MAPLLGPGTVSVGFHISMDHSDEVGGFVARWRPADTGQIRGQDLTLALTEVASLNSLELQYPCLVMGKMKWPYNRAVACERSWARPGLVEVLEKILMEFEMRSYMSEHFVKSFGNKRWRDTQRWKWHLLSPSRASFLWPLLLLAFNPVILGCVCLPLSSFEQPRNASGLHDRC